MLLHEYRIIYSSYYTNIELDTAVVGCYYVNIELDRAIIGCYYANIELDTAVKGWFCPTIELFTVIKSTSQSRLAISVTKQIKQIHIDIRRKLLKTSHAEERSINTN